MKKIMIKSGLYLLMIGMTVNVLGGGMDALIKDYSNVKNEYGDVMLPHAAAKAAGTLHNYFPEKSKQKLNQKKRPSSLASVVATEASEIIEEAFGNLSDFMKKPAMHSKYENSTKLLVALQKMNKALDLIGAKLGSVSSMQPMKAAVARTIRFFAEDTEVTKKGTISNIILAGIVNSVKAAVRIPVNVALQGAGGAVGAAAGAVGGAITGLGAGAYRALSNDLAYDHRSVFKPNPDIINTEMMKATRGLGNIVVRSLVGIVDTARLTAYGIAEGAALGFVAGTITPIIAGQKIYKSYYNPSVENDLYRNSKGRNEFEYKPDNEFEYKPDFEVNKELGSQRPLSELNKAQPLIISGNGLNQERNVSTPFSEQTSSKKSSRAATGAGAGAGVGSGNRSSNGNDILISEHNATRPNASFRQVGTSSKSSFFSRRSII